ncbi:class II fructose-bisphosphate aldolase [Kitasatospora sp. McL0602]|uniref:class II fructose-bisphosphate aldolase n=1 Tax=Kitasatospora sp. McL0602 TaxID=3439530 RepID=UPI003F88B082
MTRHARTVNELLEPLRADQALCAFNVENFDTLKPAMRAAADLECPLIVAYTVPAAQYLGYGLAAELVESLAAHYGVRYALHLDHCEYADEIRQAVPAGFTSANYLDEGAIEPGSYLPIAQALRAEFKDRASLEFVLGTLGHIDHGPDDDHAHHHGEASRAVSLEEVADFAAACEPDIIGFECGSLHGMRERSQGLDLELVAGVAQSTGLPIVLHGSSGVRGDDLLAGLDAGIRKVNIETAIRAVYMDTVRATASGSGDGARKPRYLTKATDAALHATYTDFLTSYTLRKG